MNKQQEIEKIAYELYLQRGGSSNNPVEDWMTAEQIFIERTKGKQRKTTAPKNSSARKNDKNK
ncbi:MAG TPA: DUF2934 domain-containing protein [Acidobacteriota bacterium]|nr:DUF2934 domain-containing protein [Acidobacteriota bacterium]